MNVSTDQVRAATRAAAAVITADKVPPLRLEESPGSRRLARRTRPWSRPRSPWVTPLAAAAAVAIVVAGGVAAGSLIARSGNGHPANPAAPRRPASASPYSGVPAYYVAVDSPSLAVVRATATGAILARITTQTPFVGVTGAADDRTFVLDAQRSVMGPTVQWPGQPAFSLLRLSASGAEESFTPLAIPAMPAGTVVTGLALSPDGSKLAVEADTGTWGQPGLLEIRVYTLATGAFRTWSTTGSTDPVDPGGFTGSGVDGSQTISWAADSTTLAFDWMNKARVTGVRLLDTTASGDNLITDSRLAVTLSSPAPLSGGQPSTSTDHVSECVTDSIMSLDGSSIVCGYTTTSMLSNASNKKKLSGRALNQALSREGSDTTTGFIRYSTSTGKQALVFGVYQFKGQAGGDISEYWVNSTGTALIGAILTPHGIRIGVINGETFTPLPGITVLGAAAW